MIQPNFNGAPSNRDGVQAGQPQPGAYQAAQPGSGNLKQQLQSQLQTQYNTPVNLYSEDNIKEVLDQQTETLASGVKG